MTILIGGSHIVYDISKT